MSFLRHFKTNKRKITYSLFLPQIIDNQHIKIFTEIFFEKGVINLNYQLILHSIFGNSK